MADADGASTKLDNVFETCCVLHNMLLNTDSEAFEADHDASRVNKLRLLALHNTITIQPTSDFSSDGGPARRRAPCHLVLDVAESHPASASSGTGGLAAWYHSGLGRH